MDLASILEEINAVDDFKDADQNRATASFCMRACKVLDKVLKQTDNVNFEHLVIGVWIVIGSFNELLPQLVDGTFLIELADKLFRQSARIVLDIKWQQLGEEEKSRQNFQSSLSACHLQMAPRGFTRFGVLQSLMDNPWTDPVLTMVMGSEEDNEEGEGLAYIHAQDPEILKLRVELMQQENCDEFALNLCTWCLKHPALSGDLSLRKTQLVLLHQLSYIDRLQEECQTVGIEDSIYLINSLQSKEDHKELCTMLAQTFLVQNWIKPSDNDAKKELLRLWIQLQYQVDRDQDRFISSLWAVAKLSHSTKQLLFIIDAVREQCGDTFIQFYTDLCVFAINVDKGCWEKLKESSTSGPNEEILARKKDMAQVCDKLAHIISHVSPKISFCCALTSFAMVPSEQSLKAVCDAYKRKSHVGIYVKSHCCSNCASDQGKCLKNDDSDTASRDVNIATLYEVERLCGMLKPAYLSVDSDFCNLLSVCKQYLMKENGDVMKSALMGHKSFPLLTPASVMTPEIASPSPYSDLQVSGFVSHLKPSIVRGPTAINKPTDAASQVNNTGMIQNPGVLHHTVNIPGTLLSQNMHQKATNLQIGQTIAKRETLIPTQQQDKCTAHPGRQNTGHSQIQQLVLQQLSSDMVQTLLHLIQSGQISAVQLNHIMTKNPNMSVQILHNIVNQAKQAQKSVSSKVIQKQQIHPLQQIQKLQSPQRQQLSPQLQGSSQSSFGLSPVLQSTSFQQSGLTVKRPASIKLQPSSQVRVQQPGVQCTITQPRVISTQLVMQQSVPKHQAPARSHSQTCGIHQQLLSGQPLIPTIPTLHLSKANEIHITQPLHVMTLRHSTPLQSTNSGIQSPRVVIQTSSQMMSHLSGRNVMSVQQQEQPRIMHLPSTTIALNSQITRPAQQPITNLIAKAPEPCIAVQSTGHGAVISRSHVPGEVTVGNRNYSINNLLFTGEQQNSALSITLPDKLPEISVDTISDTLRALSNSSATSSHFVPKTPMQQIQMPIARSVSEAVVHISTARVPMTSVKASEKKFPPNAVTQQPKRYSKLTSPTPPTQVKISSPTTTAIQLPLNSQDQPYGQPLPSFSTLFTSSPSPLPVPVPSTTLLTTTSTISLPITLASTSCSASRKDVGGQGKGQKKVCGLEKTSNKVVKKGKVAVAAEKEEMMRLLKQAMTINIEKKESREGNGSAYLHTSGISADSSRAQSSGAPENFPSPTIRPIGTKSSQAGRVSLNPAVSQQPVNVPHPNTSLPVIVKGPVSVSPVTFSVTLPIPSFSSVASSHSAPSEVYSQRFPPFNSTSQSSPNLHTIPSSKETAGSQETLSTSVYSMVNSSSSPSSAASSLATSSAVTPPSTWQIEKPVDSYDLSPHLSVTAVSNSLNTTIEDSTNNVYASPIKTYSRQDSILNKSPRQDLVEPAVSLPIPTGILPEGGIMETSKDGDQSIATYRCIICAKAFMTLDALRLHVKQICKPGLSQPANLGSRMALNKAEATEAGLETSTVFQCMRCFELCISETGIREHKQICKKAPKSKTKPKSRAKPKLPKSEEEQATEAKVMEVLNKCLGENREKLLEETKAQAAKQASAKKRPPRKRPSLEAESPVATGFPSVDSSLNSKKSKKEDSSFDAHLAAPVQEITNGSVESAGKTLPMNQSLLLDRGAALNTTSVMVNTTESAFPYQTPSFLATSSVPSDTPVHSQLEQTSTSSGDAKVEEKPKPKRKYYPKKKTPIEGIGEVVQNDMDRKEPCDSAAGAKKLTGETKPVRQRKPKKEPGPPSPRYKEIVGSGGRSFFKCLNCGQTLCSIENFGEHWLECIVKKPFSSKPRRVPKEKKIKVDSGPNKCDTTTNISLDNTKTTVQTVASASCISEVCDNGTDSVPLSDRHMERRDDREIKHGKEHSSDVIGLSFQKESWQLYEKYSLEAPDKRSVLDLSAETITSSEVVSPEENCVVFKDETVEVINELRVETTIDSTVLLPQLKKSMVVLEKINIPEKGVVNSSDICSLQGEMNNEKIIGGLSKLEKSRDSLVIPGKYSSRNEAFQLKKIRRPQCSKTVLRSAVELKLKDKQGRSVETASKPQIGDSKYCGLCQRYFSRRLVLIQHVASKHVQSYTVRKLGDTSSYFCHLCQKVFPQFSQYMAHVSSHSQAIIKKFNELLSLNERGCPGRSHRIAIQKGTAGRSVKKHGRASPKYLTKTKKIFCNDDRRKKCGRTCSKKLNFAHRNSTSVEAKVKVTTPLNDRRSSGRAAQKQALSKIFISSLGINRITETLKEANKRKLSAGEKISFETKPKQIKGENSKNEKAESEGDEENAEESGIEADQGCEPSAMETGRGAASSVLGPKATDQASMDASTTPSLAREQGKSLSGHCLKSGLLPVNCPQNPSPLTMATKKPSFLDSFLSFVSNRSPEAPLPLCQSKRRCSYMNSCGEKDSIPFVSDSRPSSCERTLPRSVQTPALVPTTSQVMHAVKPLQPSVSTAETVRTLHSKSPQGSNVVSVVSRRKSWEYDNVYYFGKFEEQLTKQCKVILGDRIHQEPHEELAVNVKQCSVNLGPKVSPENILTGTRFVASQNKEKNEHDVETAFSKASDIVPVPVCSVADDRTLMKNTSNCVAPENIQPSVCGSSYTLSRHGVPASHDEILPLRSHAVEEDELCVEATLSVLTLPVLISADTDVTTIVNSVASGVAEHSFVQTVTSSNPTVETVTVSTIALTTSEPRAVSPPQSFQEIAEEVFITSESGRSSDVRLTVEDDVRGDMNIDSVTGRHVEAAAGYRLLIESSETEDSKVVENVKEEVECERAKCKNSKQELKSVSPRVVGDKQIDYCKDTVQLEDYHSDALHLEQHFAQDSLESSSCNKVNIISEFCNDNSDDITSELSVNKSRDTVHVHEYLCDSASGNFSVQSENLTNAVVTEQVEMIKRSPVFKQEQLYETSSPQQEYLESKDNSEFQEMHAKKELQIIEPDVFMPEVQVFFKDASDMSFNSRTSEALQEISKAMQIPQTSESSDQPAAEASNNIDTTANEIPENTLFSTSALITVSFGQDMKGSESADLNTDIMSQSDHAGKTESNQVIERHNDSVIAEASSEQVEHVERTEELDFDVISESHSRQILENMDTVILTSVYSKSISSSSECNGLSSRTNLVLKTCTSVASDKSSEGSEKPEGKKSTDKSSCGTSSILEKQDMVESSLFLNVFDQRNEDSSIQEMFPGPVDSKEHEGMLITVPSEHQKESSEWKQFLSKSENQLSVVPFKGNDICSENIAAAETDNCASCTSADDSVLEIVIPEHSEDSVEPSDQMLGSAVVKVDSYQSEIPSRVENENHMIDREEVRSEITDVENTLHSCEEEKSEESSTEKGGDKADSLTSPKGQTSTFTEESQQVSEDVKQSFILQLVESVHEQQQNPGSLSVEDFPEPFTGQPAVTQDHWQGNSGCHGIGTESPEKVTLLDVQCPIVDNEDDWDTSNDVVNVISFPNDNQPDESTSVALSLEVNSKPALAEPDTAMQGNADQKLVINELPSTADCDLEQNILVSNSEHLTYVASAQLEPFSTTRGDAVVQLPCSSQEQIIQSECCVQKQPVSKIGQSDTLHDHEDSADQPQKEDVKKSSHYIQDCEDQQIVFQEHAEHLSDEVEVNADHLQSLHQMQVSCDDLLGSVDQTLCSPQDPKDQFSYNLLETDSKDYEQKSAASPRPLLLELIMHAVNDNGGEEIAVLSTEEQEEKTNTVELTMHAANDNDGEISEETAVLSTEEQEENISTEELIMHTSDDSDGGIGEKTAVLSTKEQTSTEELIMHASDDSDGGIGEKTAVLSTEEQEENTSTEELIMHASDDSDGGIGEKTAVLSTEEQEENTSTEEHIMHTSDDSDGGIGEKTAVLSTEEQEENTSTEEHIMHTSDDSDGGIGEKTAVLSTEEQTSTEEHIMHTSDDSDGEIEKTAVLSAEEQEENTSTEEHKMHTSDDSDGGIGEKTAVLSTEEQEEKTSTKEHIMHISDDSDGEMGEETAVLSTEEQEGKTPSVESASSVKCSASENSAYDIDPDNDLPELCIVPDPEVVVLSKIVEKKTEKKNVPTFIPLSDDPDTVLSTVIDDHQIKIVNLKVNIKRTTPAARDIYIARVETKEEVVQEEPFEEPFEVPTRKPLLGVKSLRNVHKPEPFVWEADGEEDCKKRARNERSLKAFRQKVQVAPFSWDSDGTDHGVKEKEKPEKRGFRTATSTCWEQTMQVSEEESPVPFSFASVQIDAKKDFVEANQGCIEEKDSEVSDSKSNTILEDSVGDCSKTDSAKKITDGKDLASSSASGRIDLENSQKDSNGDLGKKNTSRTVHEMNTLGKHTENDDPGMYTNVRRIKHSKDKTDLDERDKICSVPPDKEIAGAVHKYEICAGLKVLNVSPERERQTSRSRETRRAGSSDNIMPQISACSMSRNRKTASASKEKPFRKSRSCDIEPHFIVEQNNSLETELHKEIVIAGQIVEPGLVSKDLSDVKDTDVHDDKKCSPEAKNSPKILHHKVTTRSSEKASQKWRQKRHLSSSVDIRSSGDETRSTKSADCRPKFKRKFNQKCDCSHTRIDGSSSRAKIKRYMNRDSEHKMSVEDSISTRSRHSSKNSKQVHLENTAVKPKLLQIDAFSPGCAEIGQGDLKSLRRRGVSASKNQSLVTSDTYQNLLRPLRRRALSTSVTSQSSRTLRSGDKSVSKKKYVKLSGNVTSNKDPNPASQVATSSGPEVKSSSATRSHRSKEGKLEQPVVQKNTYQGAPLTLSKKPELVKSDAVSLVKNERIDSPTVFISVPERIDSDIKSSTVQPRMRAQHNSKSEYLGAMVRRRQTPASWRSGSTHSAKKLRVPSSKALQYEIIRVEPVRADSPTDQRRTRSCDRDAEHPPRTVHTRVSVDELKPSLLNSDSGKLSSDQKWSINRHFTPSDKKRNADQHFPFSFQRARTRMQTK